MSEQVEEVKANVERGCRVKVTSYWGDTDNHYVGLEGEVVELYFRRDALWVLVKLDNDPNPALEGMLGGLPCLPDEVEVVNGNPASN